MLPTFLVIGAAKSGTTSLYYYLRQHPDVYLAPGKGTNYYWAECAELGRGIPASLDDYARCFAGARGQRAVGEIAPHYLNSPTAPERIRRDLPGVRLTAVLRNPIERAWSDYLGRVRIAREVRPADVAIRPGERIFDHGLYHPRLTRYISRFPREHLQILLHDDFVADARATLRALFTFLGVDPDAPIDTRVRHNAAALPRFRGPNRVLWNLIPLVHRVWPARWQGSGLGERILLHTYRGAGACPTDLADRLRAAYRQDVIDTGQLIGRDLSHWLGLPGETTPVVGHH